MKTRLITLLSSVLLLSGAPAQEALRENLFAAADSAMEAARAAGAQQLAPDSYEDGMEAYADAEQDLARERSADRIRRSLDEAVEHFVAATDAAEIARVTLAAVLKTRDDAANANADTFAPELWAQAQETLDDATRRLESGSLRRARSDAEEAETLYRDAELTAIKAQYLSQTRALLAEAEQARVSRYAPKTLAQARTLLEQAERELNENRYDTDLPRSLARQANYQARHAIHLAERIQTIRDEGLTEEDIILEYEEPLVRIAAAADQTAPLDAGVEPVVDELVSYIERLREETQQARVDLEESRQRIAELEDEIRSLDEQLGGISQERVALVQRLEAESRLREQFETIGNLFSREEARVSRADNAIILRLVGLTFESGQADVGEQYRDLLENVRRAAGVFPQSQIVVEGHTDSYGSDEANLSLSRRRAEAVSTYLAEQLGVRAFRISAVGYGETRPIANNDTPQGRSRNRRIDVRIEPELQ